MPRPSLDPVRGARKKRDMKFAVSADAYDRFVGRYSFEIAPRFIQFAAVLDGPVLDVGCGPGRLTEALAARFGAANVAAVDPSEPFVTACRALVPGADVRVASGESLPFPDRTFGGALAQLVLTFLRDADRTAREMARVVRRGGAVAACTFEARGFELVRIFWDAARRVDAQAPDDADLPFRQTAQLEALWRGAGLREVEAGAIEVESAYVGFDELWEPFTFGIGPAGTYLAAQPDALRAEIRDAYFELLGRPPGPFSLPARAIAIRGRVGS